MMEVVDNSVGLVLLCGILFAGVIVYLAKRSSKSKNKSGPRPEGSPKDRDSSR